MGNKIKGGHASGVRTRTLLNVRSLYRDVEAGLYGVWF